MMNMTNMARGGTRIGESEANAIRPLVPCMKVRSAGHRTARPILLYPFSLSSLNKILTEIERNTCHNLTWILFAIVTRCMAMQWWAAGHIGAEHEHEDRAGGGIPDIYVILKAAGVLLR